MTDLTTPTINIEIDGQALKVPQGSMIIEAADNAGITIPRFCYHKKLTIAANCRMCLVDVENSRKPTPACATPVTEGMKVLTKSKKAIQYQKSVMEFLLINHPLDCPICDQGGECELQDLSVGYGKDVSRYNQGKRVVVDKDIGPLVATDLTRCIHCTRCVRFGAEIAGERELGMTGRGEHSQIASFLSKPLESELSGNIIDLCPVGALTSKPFRYQARAWELQQKATIAAHDCVGSNVFAHVRRGEVMRVAPRENEALNEVWLSDRDRFSYQGVNSSERLKQPMMKRNGEWVAISWGEAFDYAVQFLRRSLEKDGAEQIGGLASAHCTTEELYLFQKLLRELGCRNLDYRLRRKDFSHENQEAGLPGINASLADIETADVVLLIGSNIRKEQPIIHHRIRQASLEGAQVFAVNPAIFDFRVDNLTSQAVNIDELPLALAGVLKALLAKATDKNSLRMDTEHLLAQVDVSVEAQQIADALLAAKKPVVLAGAFAKHHPNAGLLFHLLGLVMDVAKAQGGQLTDGPNSAGATLAGVLPHRGPAGKQERPAGLNAAEMLASHRALKTYLLLNVEPGLDSAYGQRALENLEKADWVLALNPFMTSELMQYADMVLPIGTVFETSGTFINILGEWQSFQGVATPVGEARPAWKVLRVLANFLELPGFAYETSEEVLAELKGLVAKQNLKTATIMVPKNLPARQTLLKRVAEVPMYATDSLVRHASALQQTVEMQQQLQVSLSPQLAKQLDLVEGDKALIQQNNGTSLVLPVHVQAGLPDKSVLVPMGLPEVARLGEAFDQISVMRV